MARPTLTGTPRSDPVKECSDRHRRFQLAQSWWIATELVRRHPELTILETHAGGGQYDSLSLIRNGQTLVSINRGGHIHALQHPMEPVPIEAAFADGDAHRLIRALESATELAAPSKTPPTTPKTLAYRALTQQATGTVNEAQPLDIRSEYLDSSAGSGPHGRLDQFPVAAERSRERRPDDPVGGPRQRYWLVLRDETPVAAVDVDGYAYITSQVLHLPTLYAENGRSLTSTVVKALGSLLP